MVFASRMVSAFQKIQKVLLVIISKLRDAYYTTGFVGGRRIV